VSAATTRSRAPIWSTLRWKARPYPWPRAPKNSRPVTATPIELPTCWAVDSAPETEPAVAGSAWLSTVVVITPSRNQRNVLTGCTPCRLAQYAKFT